MDLKLNFDPVLGRSCGSCQLCCNLVPVKELDKAANTRCKHQSFSKGCKIYAKRPMSCMLWNCAWLVDETTDKLRRPDRSRYVIDVYPDQVIAQTPGEPDQWLEVTQIWIDPKYPYAYEDLDLRDWIEKSGKMALLRFGNERGLILCPPSVSPNGEWFHHESPLMDISEQKKEMMDNEFIRKLVGG